LEKTNLGILIFHSNCSDVELVRMKIFLLE
jgi:hypothetical protein